MSLFSLDWFKSQNQKDLEKLKVEEQRLKNELLQLDKETLYFPKPTPEPVTYNKIYRKIKLVNNVLTVILNDGSLVSRPDSTITDFLNVKNSTSEDEILSYMRGKIQVYQAPVKESDTVQQRKEETEAKAYDSLSLLENRPDFKVEEGAVYMNGINRSLPALLVAKFGSLYEKYQGLKVEQTAEYQSLKKFWLKCCLNPNARSAEDLYGFLENHHFKIDKHGNFYAYRRVVSKNTQNKELIDFVSNVYNKIKAVWKKNAADYAVYSNSEGYGFCRNDGSSGLGDINVIGNLKDLYLNLPNMQEKNYTSAHTGKEDYRVGDIISMPRNDGDDDNTISCSKGFHAASKMYDYSGFGDTPILMIINPMDVLSVPVGEVGKLRTCRWFFAMTLPEDEKYILDDDNFNVSELGDIFEEKCKVDEEYVKTSFAEEIKRHTFTTPSISSVQVNKILKTLDEMKAVLSNRVKTL